MCLALLFCPCQAPAGAFLATFYPSPSVCYLCCATPVSLLSVGSSSVGSFTGRIWTFQCGHTEGVPVTQLPARASQSSLGPTSTPFSSTLAVSQRTGGGGGIEKPGTLHGPRVQPRCRKAVLCGAVGVNTGNVDGVGVDPGLWGTGLEVGGRDNSYGTGVRFWG